MLGFLVIDAMLPVVLATKITVNKNQISYKLNVRKPDLFIGPLIGLKSK